MGCIPEKTRRGAAPCNTKNTSNVTIADGATAGFAAGSAPGFWARFCRSCPCCASSSNRAGAQTKRTCHFTHFIGSLYIKWMGFLSKVALEKTAPPEGRRTTLRPSSPDLLQNQKLSLPTRLRLAVTSCKNIPFARQSPTSTNQTSRDVLAALPANVSPCAFQTRGRRILPRRHLPVTHNG